jgi:hypothetical protein
MAVYRPGRENELFVCFFLSISSLFIQNLFVCFSHTQSIKAKKQQTRKAKNNSFDG